MPTLALLDGHSLAYRAFYALPPDLATKSGQVTNSAYGFTSMLIRMLGEHDPDAVAVAWDVGRATFRSERFVEYKAQRESAPNEFRSQLPLIKEVLEAFEIPQLEAPGFEADDLIATIVDEAHTEGWEVMVVTGDRDSFQLVGDGVQVLYTRRGITDTVEVDPAWVEERYGVRPDQYTDYAALRGDTSDNLPGVPGVGEKTATKLVASYGDLEGIYDNLDDLTPKLRENLEAAHEQVFLNRELMLLVKDVDHDLDFEAARRRPLDRTRVKELFNTLEFHSLWDRLVETERAAELPVGEVLAIEAIIARTPAEVEPALTQPSLVVEPVWEGESVAGVVLSAPETGVYVEWDRWDLVREAFNDRAVAKTVHDAKRLVRALRIQSEDLKGIVFDTALAAYVIDPTARDYTLANVAEKFAGLEVTSADAEERGAAQGTLDFSDGPDLDAGARAAEAVRRLEPLLRAELEHRSALDLYASIEVPLIEVLVDMEMAGIAVDRDYLESLGEQLREDLAELETDIHESAGGPFNINSTLQLREVLFERLELPILKKTNKGAPSTDASVLGKLSEAHPIVEQLLRYRELEKMRGTYVDGYLPLIGADGRIHAHFNQMAAATGRLSSDRPNLQNIPVRSDVGMTIRRAFVAPEGSSFLVADYSQIELRILAHLTRDPGLVSAFENDIDIHTATAARVFDVSDENVTTELRRMAKVINFGLLYGMEAFGLADRLEISREEAAAHMDAYFAQFPDVQEFMKNVVTKAKAEGYTTTEMGRRRYLPELRSDNFRIRQMGERMALNAPVQGFAADVIKLAMIQLGERLGESAAAMVLQVHDELVLEVPDADLEEASEVTVEVMEGVVELAVPLKVDVGSGKTLADTKS